MRHDQRRAYHAYQSVKEVSAEDLAEYKQAVQSLGTSVLRIGLAATLSALQGDYEKSAVKLLFRHLAGAGIPGLERGDSSREAHQVLPEKARQLGTADYMLATRELLKVAQWFKRAVQAYSIRSSGPAGA